MIAHEEGLCEAVIRLLEKEHQLERADVEYPERDHSGPPVEIRLRLGDVRFTIEHTLVEPFPQAIQTGKEFTELASEIRTSLDGQMPVPGNYRLVFPEHPTAGRHRRSHAALRAAIIDWTESAAAELHAECPERLGRDRCPRGYEGRRLDEIDGVPLSLTRVVRWSENSRHDGGLFLYRDVGGDVEPRRVIRLNTALDAKVPKLAACKAAGDVTILILEFVDIMLTNHIFIAEALEGALAGRPDWPGHIYIADTTGDDLWCLLEVVADGVFSIERPYIDLQPPDLAAR